MCVHLHIYIYYYIYIYMTYVFDGQTCDARRSRGVHSASKTRTSLADQSRNDEFVSLSLNFWNSLVELGADFPQPRIRIGLQPLW